VGCAASGLCRGAGEEQEGPDAGAEDGCVAAEDDGAEEGVDEAREGCEC
jgi:hypothetical protein